MSISSTFYVQIFHTNVILAAFSSYVLALGRNSYAKFVSLTLMKLTAGGVKEGDGSLTFRCCCFLNCCWFGVEYVDFDANVDVAVF